ncbi:DUF5789 family protein [Halohasta salina]|uniref:DUF5789 family protein n=1 Tax=Halohasta salina TaxID=2961621 RepID=UPI0020A4E095|nr:hypothetical protein [Halohasta salina]
MTDSDTDTDNIEVEDADQDSRELGVDFGDLGEELETHEYPTSVDTLVEAYGDHELELPSGEESFEEVLGPYTDEPDQQFTDAGEVRQAVLNMVGEGAVGEAGYSDRGVDSGDDTDSF